MDSDLISRSNLLARMCQENCGERQCVDAMDRCVWYYYIKQQPTVDAAPVVHGEWKISSDGYYPYCSICNYRPKGGEMTKHCPDCGAKMDGGGKA